MKQIIQTGSAPAAVGPYSQAVKISNTVYISGQIPLTTDMQLIQSSITEQAKQVFKNISAICEASGGSLSDIVKLNIYLTDMEDFAQVNEIMQQFFVTPYPARACVAVKELPKGACVEADAVMVLT